MKYVNLMHAHKEAVGYIQHYLGTHPLHLPETMDEEAFKKSMDAISKAMLEAWINGFEKARE